MRLTEQAIRALTAPDPSGKRKLHWDDEPKGFGVLCSRRHPDEDASSFSARSTGGPRRITIAPVLGVAAARQPARAKAREKLANFFYKGIDPKADPSGGTLSEALEVYLSSQDAAAAQRVELPARRQAQPPRLARPAARRDHPDDGAGAPRRADGEQRQGRGRRHDAGTPRDLQQRELPLHRREPAGRTR